MTDKQPETLKWAEAVERAHMPLLGEFLRTQNADLLRKDALLSKCLKHVASNISMTSDGTEAEDLYDAIKEELQ